MGRTVGPVCDSLCLLGPDGALFAKNSDRPPDELQLVAAAPRRPAGGSMRTQYLEIPDAGALASVMARPTWLWGAEHGVNERRVAVGNERVYTAAPAPRAPGALIGMDLVRLVLERAGSADEAVEVLGALLARHGQGGVADATHDEAYFSSFLIADPAEAWIVETSGSSWAAKRAPAAGTSISNRLGLRADWDRASADVAAGTDVDTWRDPQSPTGHADRRLRVSQGFVTAGGDRSALVAALRDHGRGVWPSPPPGELGEAFEGVSVCMHLAGYMATTSSMVVDLPRDPAAPVRCWVAPGSPCVSVYVPSFPPQPTCPDGAVATVLGDEGAWRDVHALRVAVEHDVDGGRGVLELVRSVLDPVESSLWAEADALAGSPASWATAVHEWSRRVSDVLAAAANRVRADGAVRPPRRHSSG
jgi:secernin